MIATREKLMEETLQADACMLLEYLQTRTMRGDVRPITTREALNAIHRPQPADKIIPQEQAHVLRVMERVRSMLIPETRNESQA